ncbi:NAD(P)-binding protein [Gloeopeniophorella convolvens]|nr:NAD(P)-binding protein [Gloeopeniophorella convolvens]
MLATTLIANGANVYITGRRADVLEQTAKVYNEGAARSPGRGKIFTIQGDVSQKSESTRIAAEIEAREPNGVTLLVNNAGILVGGTGVPQAPTADEYKKAYFDSVSDDDFVKTHRTNTVAPYWLSFAFLSLLEKWKAGPLGTRFVPQVVMISSMNSWAKDPAPSLRSFPYLLSKSALAHETQVLAHELLPLGVRVNGIAPGLFPSEMSHPSPRDELGRTIIENVKYDFPTPAGSGTARDVGSVLLALVVNWFINGETVLVDGGALLTIPASR